MHGTYYVIFPPHHPYKDKKIQVCRQYLLLLLNLNPWMIHEGENTSFVFYSHAARDRLDSLKSIIEVDSLNILNLSWCFEFHTYALIA